MKHNHVHMNIWIKELRSYGINAGPNHEPLEDMEYYDLRGAVASGVGITIKSVVLK